MFKNRVRFRYVLSALLISERFECAYEFSSLKVSGRFSYLFLQVRIPHVLLRLSFRYI